MQFKELVAVYGENRRKPYVQNSRVTGCKAVGTCSYHWSLKGYCDWILTQSCPDLLFRCAGSSATGIQEKCS